MFILYSNKIEENEFAESVTGFIRFFPVWYNGKSGFPSAFYDGEYFLFLILIIVQLFPRKICNEWNKA